ncbi:DUF1156 domain-containing protein [Arthrobacter sp. S39]|uniref:DUF1156 domain-containing protein n=1 Tax=Arthrobacter sp. S39 TaxID=2509720 RepID=UPI0010377177|nr:DUF1156 domain-containing protein [Arthrobacter sp. S39]TAP44623.1 DUF1156 domain-containing protein [Arthrobacter sp. S39]
MAKKKLIEVALPLDAINKQSAREKSIRHGHPSTMHLWWARRPLATARAVLFAQLVDDPSENASEYREEGMRREELDVNAYVERRVSAERARLFALIERMVDWDNLNDTALFKQVRAEIMRSTDGKPPAIFDPFAGGGTIPLEAQRLGLQSHASDLNPVAVLINKALIEIPPKFANHAPVFPGSAASRMLDWAGATGLAEDVRRYGEWMRDEAEKRIGHMYPQATLENGATATVIAWIWGRTVTCPNPACGIETPLVRSWWLGKKKGKEAYIVPSVVDGKVDFAIGHDPKRAPTKVDDGTMSGRAGGVCVSCNTAVPVPYIKCEGKEGRLGARLMATVAEGTRKRIYLSPTSEHEEAALVDAPGDVPTQKLGIDPRNIWTPSYGLDTFASLFTNRQLTALATFSDLVGEARARVLQDALATGMAEGSRLEAGGSDAAAYADAVAIYLGFVVSRLTDYSSAVTTWASNAQMEILRNVFARQAIPMAWDFAEGNPLAGSSGGLDIMIRAVTRAVEKVPAQGLGLAEQRDAANTDYTGMVISTDPPYYDNIAYSDLSDFFYIWLRRSLREVMPQLLSTMLVPKADELVANPYRHGGVNGAREFFEVGFERVFERARETASEHYPMTVYYAFKQSELEAEGLASTGWETILGGMIHAGWTISGTWPVRSERSGRMISIGTNALASSIVLVLRPRPEDAPIIDRRGLLVELRSTLPESLRVLQQGSIAPVDLAQAAIGPGMAIFSKYAQVLEPNGQAMSVRDALRQINAILDEVLAEQEGDFDGDTRWCLAWFETHAFEVAAYGEAETLANAKNASVAALARAGVISSGGGKVKLLDPADLPDDYDPRLDDRISLWEVVLYLAKALDEKGLDAAGRLLAGAEARGLDMSAAHELAYRLYSISDKCGLTKPGILFNTLGVSWPEVRAAANATTSAHPVAEQFDFESLA